MKISYNLVSASAAQSPIRVVITHRGKVYRKSVGITADTANFKNSKTGNVRTDKALKLILVGLESCLDELSGENDINEALRHVYDGQWHDMPTERTKTAQRPSFWQYVDTYVTQDVPAKKNRKSNMALVEELMGRDDDWNDINSAWFFRLSQKMNEKGLSKNYQGTIIGRVKAIMGEGRKLKYHSSTDYSEIRKPASQTDSVYLTEAELQRLWDLDLKDSLESKVRDLFLIGCYTGARFEDYSQFSKDNIKGREFYYIQQKTGARVTLPLSPKLKACLQRNGWQSPSVGQVVFNRYIKRVCMRAAINERIQVRISKGERFEHKTLFKYQMVSSHTCRRTLCTLLAQNKVPLNQIMVISGHKSLTSLQHYLRQNDQDLQKTLGNLEYFK